MSDRKSLTRSYACVKRQGDTHIICKTRYAEVVLTDTLFWAVLQKICSDTKTLQKYIEKTSGKQLTKNETTKEKFQERLQAISNEKTVVMQWFSQGLLTQEQATQKLASLKNEETRLSAKLFESVPEHTPQIDLKGIVNAVKNCPLDTSSKRAVVLQNIDKIFFIRTDKTHGKKHKAYRVEFDIHFKNT